MRQPSQKQLGWCDWTLFITNIPTPLAGIEDVLVLARARWQIELIFKLWKQHGQIAHFKIPRYVKFVSEFPMTVTGKIQKFRMQEMAIEELGLIEASQVETA